MTIVRNSSLYGTVTSQALVSPDSNPSSNTSGVNSAWFTVWVFPAALMVAVRAGPPLAETWYATLPDPLPLDPLVMVIQLATSNAIQGHPDWVLTVKVPLPPVLGKFRDVGLTL